MDLLEVITRNVTAREGKPNVLGYLICLSVRALVASPWLSTGPFATVNIAKDMREKFWGRVPVREGSRPCAWFHAVSVGEVNLLQTLLDRFNAIFRVGTASSPRRPKPGLNWHERNTPDIRSSIVRSISVGRSMRRAADRPDLLVLAELELWPNLIRLAKQHQCRVAIVNGRLSHAVSVATSGFAGF